MLVCTLHTHTHTETTLLFIVPSQIIFTLPLLAFELEITTRPSILPPWPAWQSSLQHAVQRLLFCTVVQWTQLHNALATHSQVQHVLLSSHCLRVQFFFGGALSRAVPCSVSAVSAGIFAVHCRAQHAKKWASGGAYIVFYTLHLSSHVVTFSS